jgi:hypothetical protein
MTTASNTSPQRASLGVAGCPSTSVYRRDHCQGLFCCTCHEPSTCDSEELAIKSIGHWFCDVPACVETEARLYGTSVDGEIRWRERRRRKTPVCRGKLVTAARLRQLLLLGPPHQQEEARAALDEALPRWQRWRARERCADFLGIKDETRGGR